MHRACRDKQEFIRETRQSDRLSKAMGVGQALKHGAKELRMGSGVGK